MKVSAGNVVPSEGEGTAENPYLIGTAEEMYLFAEIVNNGHIIYESDGYAVTWAYYSK